MKRPWKGSGTRRKRQWERSGKEVKVTYTRWNGCEKALAPTSWRHAGGRAGHDRFRRGCEPAIYQLCFAPAGARGLWERGEGSRKARVYESRGKRVHHALQLQ